EEQPRVSHLPALSARIVATLLAELGRRLAAARPLRPRDPVLGRQNIGTISRGASLRLATGRLDGCPSILPRCILSLPKPEHFSCSSPGSGSTLVAAGRLRAAIRPTRAT